MAESQQQVGSQEPAQPIQTSDIEFRYIADATGLYRADADGSRPVECIADRPGSDDLRAQSMSVPNARREPSPHSTDAWDR